MEKSKNAGMMRAARSASQSKAERVLLAHVEMCYSVALALTHDPASGQRLARATLLWAWQRQMEMGTLGGGDVKMALLRDLRRRFLKDFRPAVAAGARSAGSSAFAPVAGDPAMRTIAAADPAKNGAAG